MNELSVKQKIPSYSSITQTTSQYEKPSTQTGTYDRQNDKFTYDRMTVLPYIYFGILCTYEDDGYEQGRMKGHASAVIPQAAGAAGRVEQ
jgi:hypothetical protein